MISEAQLRDLVLGGETSRLDFKIELRLDNPKQKADFIKDMVSFANGETTPSYIVIGIDDAGDVAGPSWPLPDEATLRQLLNSNIDPPVEFTFCRLSLDGTMLGVIEIPPINERFHMISKDVKGKAISH